MATDNPTSEDIQDLAEAINNLTNARCDFTGWSLTESLAMIAQSLNVIAEQVQKESES